MGINYDRDTKIDEKALDIEWLRQADLAREYGRLWTIIHKKVKKLRERKKTVRSELIIEANKNPMECCFKKKPNKEDIEAFYRTSPKYIGVVDELLEMEEELEYAEIAKNEMAFTRKASLENLVTLHGQMYFAGPKEPRNITKERIKFMRRLQKEGD
jgi:hypothetical protein